MGRDTFDTERLIRLEEQLTTERSVRKTRDDQMVHRFQEFSVGLKEVSEELDDIASDFISIKHSLRHLEQGSKDRDETQKGLQKAVKENTDTLKSLEGSLRAFKWMWPVLMMLLSALISLAMQNIDFKTTTKIENATKSKVKTVDTTKSSEEK